MENENLTMDAIHGHVGTDPVMSATVNGTSRLSFRVGIPRRVQTAEGEWLNTDPHYVTVAMYGKSAERTHGGIQKGDQILALGNLREYEVTDPERGPRVLTEFRAARVGHDLNLTTVQVQRRSPQAQAGAQTTPRGRVGILTPSLEDNTSPASTPSVPTPSQTAWTQAAINQKVAAGVVPPPSAPPAHGVSM